MTKRLNDVRFHTVLPTLGAAFHLTDMRKTPGFKQSGLTYTYHLVA